MIMAVASGKGGTGKTTVAVNLALVAQSREGIQFLDTDVEEPNAHLFLKPDFHCSETVGLPVPQIDQEKCTCCGKCAEICAFNALAVLGETVLTFPELCHGCGGCSYFCPEKAIIEVSREIGVLEKGLVGQMVYLHGRLRVGETMAPPLIEAVKEKVNKKGITIIDVPPGTSCPAVSAVRGSDYCLLVTEPTPFGLHDLQLSVEMLRKLKIPFGVVINRADMGDEGVEDYCQAEDIPILMKIPWDEEVARLYSRGQVAVNHSLAWKKRFAELWNIINLEQKEKDVI